MSTKGYLVDAPLDSSRFGIRVMRGTFETIDSINDLAHEIESAHADLVILRVPAGESSIAVAIQRKGKIAIHADTLVYYSIDLTAQPVPATESQAQVRAANAGDYEKIAEIAEKGFSDYRAHYSANPLLPKELVLSGYVEWALSRLDPNNPTSQTWVVSIEDKVAGFATCDVENETVEIILNAVHPDCERRGLYGALLRHIIHHYSKKSLKELVISTQVWNYTVQRQWARAGLRILRAYDTYHLDRRLTTTGQGK